MRCSLKKGELFVLETISERSLCCLQGSLWVTVGDGNDYLITDCRAIRKLAGRRALIEALEDSEIRLEDMSGSALSIRSGIRRAAGFLAGA